MFVEVLLAEEWDKIAHEQVMARVDESIVKLRAINRRNRERFGTPEEFIGLCKLPMNERLRRVEEILRRINSRSKETDPDWRD